MKKLIGLWMTVLLASCGISASDLFGPSFDRPDGGGGHVADDAGQIQVSSSAAAAGSGGAGASAASGIAGAGMGGSTAPSSSAVASSASSAAVSSSSSVSSSASSSSAASSSTGGPMCPLPPPTGNCDCWIDPSDQWLKVCKDNYFCQVTCPFCHMFDPPGCINGGVIPGTQTWAACCAAAP